MKRIEFPMRAVPHVSLDGKERGRERSSRSRRKRNGNRSMNALPELGKRVFVEIQIAGERFDFQKDEWAYLQVWNKNDFIDLFRDRMGKSEIEVRNLLESLTSILARR